MGKKAHGDSKKMAPPPKEVEEDCEDEEISEDEEDDSSGEEEVVTPQKERQEGYHSSIKEDGCFTNRKQLRKLLVPQVKGQLPHQPIRQLHQQSRCSTW